MYKKTAVIENLSGRTISMPKMAQFSSKTIIDFHASLGSVDCAKFYKSVWVVSEL